MSRKSPACLGLAPGTFAVAFAFIIVVAYWGPSTSCWGPFTLAVTVTASIPASFATIDRPFLTLLSTPAPTPAALLAHPFLIGPHQVAFVAPQVLLPVLAITGHPLQRQVDLGLH